MTNVVYFTPRAKQANVTDQILSAFVADYSAVLSKFEVNIEDPVVAFDVATIRYLMQGMAHRSQGEEHPSQKLLNSVRENMLGF